jgi:hypothetical protein
MTREDLFPNLECETKQNKNKNITHVEQEPNKILLQRKNKNRTKL